LQREKRPAVEMEMIVVGGIIIRANGQPEIGACGAMYRAQEATFRGLFSPMPANADRPSVGQHEAADIRSVGGGVLTAHIQPKRIAGNIAAGIAAVALNGPHWLAQYFLGQRLHLVLEPQGQGHRCFAGKLVETGARTGRRDETNSILPAATVLDRTIRNGLRLDVGRLERARTNLGIVPDAGQAPIDRPGA